MSKIYELPNGDTKLLVFQNGTFAVYDYWEFDRYDNIKPEFIGHLEDALAYLEDCRIAALLESIG